MLLWGGKPADVIKTVEQGKIALLISEEIVAEISRVLIYPKLSKIYRAEGLRVEDLIEAILKISKFVNVTKKIEVVKEHPSDDKFIECAHTAHAQYLVSGDKHLLKLASYKKTRIISVTEFLQIIQ